MLRSQINNGLVWTVTSPYSYTWSNVPTGSYSLTAKATDNLGAHVLYVLLYSMA